MCDHHTKAPLLLVSTQKICDTMFSPHDVVLGFYTLGDGPDRPGRFILLRIEIQDSQARE
jgi:hypothetical protein